MEQFGKFMATVIMLLLNTIIVGITFSVLWGWFIVPTFNVAELTIIQAIGISLVKNYLFFSAFKKNDTGKATFKGFVKSFATKVVISGIALGFGYIYHLFM